VASAWRGWPEAGSRPAGEGSPAPWIELSHPLRADLDRVPFFPAARFDRVMRLPDDRMNVTAIQMVCHYGTHVDAPRHFIADGPAFHEIPLDRLHGPGVVWRVPASPFAEIDAADLANARPALRPGDIVLLDTGWSAHHGTARYAENPCLTEAAAAWLVEHGAKLVGVDFATPDLAVPRRPADFAWPVHHILLASGVLIAEHLTNLGALAGHRIEAMFLALNVEGADGAPARVVARKVSSR
jgi:kynurenine formamidase